MHKSKGIREKRKRGDPNSLWQPVQAAVLSQSPDIIELHLVLQRQAKGEPNYWSLFACRKDKAGLVLQVNGDEVNMKYYFVENVRIFSSESYITNVIWNRSFID